MQTTLILLLIISEKALAPIIDPFRASVTIEEQRAFVKCHVLLGSTVPEISKSPAEVQLRPDKYNKYIIFTIYTINFGMKGVLHVKMSHAVEDLVLRQMKNINIHLKNS